jgi:hypothetical protein
MAIAGDEVTHWLKIAEVALIASVKFLLAPFEAERYGMSYWNSYIITTGGGLAGIFIFYFSGQLIANWWQHNVAKVKAFFTRRPVSDFEGDNRKVMTRKNKLIVRVKNKFGLTGIAFVTPCIISIPIGTLVAVAFYRKRRPVLLYLIISLVLWSFVLNYIAQWLQLSQYMPSALQAAHGQ